MKKIQVNTLRAGMIFSEPVYIEGDSLLVPAGIAIRKRDLVHLNAWGIETVETAGNVAAEGPAAPITDKTPKPGVPEKGLFRAAAQENAEAYRRYINLIKQLDEVFAHIGANTPVERGTIDTIANTLLRVIQERRKQFVGYILGSTISGHDLAKSSVNTAILSAFTAMELKLANSRIIQVVTGALLRDTGMLRLPRYITNTREGLSETESQALQIHSQYSYKIICTELRYPEDVGVIALQHHERWDGGGYPQKRSLTAIAPGARIVAVADAFEALVGGQPARNATAGYQALKRLMADKGFDPAVLKAFMYAMGKPREPRQ